MESIGCRHFALQTVEDELDTTPTFHRMPLESEGKKALKG
jgi:hypothetical protein